MLTIYFVTACALLLGWIRRIPKIQNNFWLENGLFVVAFIGLSWSGVHLAREADSLDDDLALICMGVYFVYMIFMNVVFCHIVKIISKN